MSWWAPYYSMGYGWPVGYPGQLVFGQEQHMPPMTQPVVHDDPNVSISDKALARLLALVAAARGVKSSTSIGRGPMGGGGRALSMQTRGALGVLGARGGFAGQRVTTSQPFSSLPGRAPQHTFAAPMHDAAWGSAQAAPGFQASWNGVPVPGGVSVAPGVPAGAHGGGFDARAAGGGSFAHPYFGPGGSAAPATRAGASSAPMHPHHAPRVHPHTLRRWAGAWRGEPFFYFGCWWVLTPEGWVCYLDYPYFY